MCSDLECELRTWFHPWFHSFDYLDSALFSILNSYLGDLLTLSQPSEAVTPSFPCLPLPRKLSLFSDFPNPSCLTLNPKIMTIGFCCSPCCLSAFIHPTSIYRINTKCQALCWVLEIRTKISAFNKRQAS